MVFATEAMHDAHVGRYVMCDGKNGSSDPRAKLGYVMNVELFGWISRCISL